jgi:hypothetical protein
VSSVDLNMLLDSEIRASCTLELHAAARRSRRDFPSAVVSEKYCATVNLGNIRSLYAARRAEIACDTPD